MAACCCRICEQRWPIKCLVALMRQKLSCMFGFGGGGDWWLTDLVRAQARGLSPEEVERRVANANLSPMGATKLHILVFF